ncbi:MAG: isopenicillin N synthase-like dioxygenase [Thermoproteota archaeon]|jgi:isopenicillin N synthase-like dioxygenase
MSERREVPKLSLLSYVQGDEVEKEKFINELMYGLKEYGFIVLKDHTVDQQIIKDAYAKIHEFFHLDVKIKEKYISHDGGGQRGYTAFGIEHAKDSEAPDLKEFWHTGREVPKDHRWHEMYPDNLWPSEIEGFESIIQTLFDSLSHTSLILLEAIGKGLDVSENFFKEMAQDGNSILRPIHYPPVPNDADRKSIRAAAHADINLITLLVGATSSGLQLQDKDGSWLNVDSEEGELVVDSGDMLELLTNGVLPATIHRVINPEDTSKDRYSIPFFVHPNPETLLKCIPSCLGDGEKYEPINSHEFLMKRLREIGLM